MCLHTGANELYGQHWTFAAPNVHLIEYIQFSDPGIPLEECNLASSSAAGRRAYRATPGTPVPQNGQMGLHLMQLMDPPTGLAFPRRSDGSIFHG